MSSGCQTVFRQFFWSGKLLKLKLILAKTSNSVYNTNTGLIGAIWGALKRSLLLTCSLYGAYGRQGDWDHQS
jgi:hypothetical protein